MPFTIPCSIKEVCIPYCTDEEVALYLHGLNVCLFSRGAVTPLDVVCYYEGLTRKLSKQLTVKQVNVIRELKQHILFHLNGVYKEMVFRDGFFRAEMMADSRLRPTFYSEAPYRIQHIETNPVEIAEQAESMVKALLVG